MPKIIEDLRETILLNAKQILLDEGYDKLTIRSVARACGVASGTIYNYFPSKEILEANVMLNDWLHAIDTMKSTADHTTDLQELLECMYREIRSYSNIYSDTWADSKAPKTLGSGPFIYERHSLLVSQLSAILFPKFEAAGIVKPQLTSQMIAETLLRESISGKSDEFRELVELIGLWQTK